MTFIDAHTHLNSDELYPHREKHLADFIAIGGVGLINVGVDAVCNKRAIEIAEKSEKLYGSKCVVKATVGGHPSEVSYAAITDMSSALQYMIDLEILLVHHRGSLVAIGECGMDAHYPGFSSEIASLQLEFFRLQCLLARKYSLPVVIHSRDAFDLTMEVLKDFIDLSIYFHCWGYGVGEAKILIDTFPKLRFGFCGNSTYPKAVALRESFLFIVDQVQYTQGSIGILLETDAPWLAPQSKRGQRHAPMFIPDQYKFLAELSGQSVEYFSQRVISDWCKLYNLLILN